MKILILVFILIIQLNIIFSQIPPYPLPQATYNWDFETQDSLEGLKGNISGGASVRDGKLSVNGSGQCIRTDNVQFEVTSHTLMAWVKLNNLNQYGGSAFTIQVTKDNDEFNGLIYGERTRKEWMVGSTNMKRWSPKESNNEKEKIANQKFVFIAATFLSNGNKQTIKLFRQGKLLDQYEKSDTYEFPFEANKINFLFGKRADVGLCDYCGLNGEIEHAMFFNRALPDNDVKKIQNQITVCFNECEICQDGHGCTKCKDDSFHLPDCSHKKEGWFIERVDMNTYDRIYKECHKSCLTCKGPTKNDCLSCHTDPDTLFRLPFQNFSCPCKSGYYDDDIHQECQKCQLCGACIGGSLTDCLPCPIGTYDDIINKFCLPCEFPCQECSSKNTCTACVNDPKRSKTNNCQCQYGYVENSTTKSCECQEKTRNPTNDCKCADGYYEVGDIICAKCQQPCSNCSSLGTCLSCADTNMSILLNCKQCKDGFFMNVQNECQKCKSFCITCEDITGNCKKCGHQKHRQVELPCNCEISYYDNGDGICQKCQQGCELCNESGKCTKCYDNLLLPQCKDREQEGYFTINSPEGTKFGECNKKCKQCKKSPDNCITCRKGLNRMGIDQGCNCKKGYHDNNGNSIDCYPCPVGCISCVQGDKCIECDNQHNRILYKFTGECICQKNYKSKNGQEKCRQCYNYKQECLFQCPQNTVANKQLFICEEIQFIQVDNAVIIILCSVFVILFQIAFVLFVLKFNSLFKKWKYLTNIQSKDQQIRKMGSQNQFITDTEQCNKSLDNSRCSLPQEN